MLFYEPVMHTSEDKQIFGLMPFWGIITHIIQLMLHTGYSHSDGIIGTYKYRPILKKMFRHLRSAKKYMYHALEAAFRGPVIAPIKYFLLYTLLSLNHGAYPPKVMYYRYMYSYWSHCIRD